MPVTGIFTGTTSSPSCSLRQSHDRYAIRAGRNLPDKEFRYLRTVIVTAAVHRAFSSQLHPSCDKLTAPFNLPAPGRRQPRYVVFDFAETCVFRRGSEYFAAHPFFPPGHIALDVNFDALFPAGRVLDASAAGG